MAAAIGQSINIPILIRALACDLYKVGPPADTWTFSRDFLLGLDAGVDPDDPTAPVNSYLLDWWTGQSAPDQCDILSTTTLLQCLVYHQRVSGKMTWPAERSTRTDEWQRDLALMPEGLTIECGQCRLYRAVSVRVMDSVQDYRHHLNGLKVAQDTRVEQTTRRAAGFFELHQAAILKENTVTLERQAAAEEAGESSFSLLRQRSTAKGKNRPSMSRVVARVQDEANEELQRLATRPDVKWTWGVDLIPSDVLRLANMLPKPDMHFGYMQSLRDGRLAPGSVTTEWQDDGLCTMYVGPDIPLLPEHLWPLHFTEPPLRSWSPDPVIEQLKAAIGQSSDTGPDIRLATTAAARAVEALATGSQADSGSDVEMEVDISAVLLTVPANCSVFTQVLVESTNVARQSREYLVISSDSEDLETRQLPSDVQPNRTALPAAVLLAASSQSPAPQRSDSGSGKSIEPAMPTHFPYGSVAAVAAAAFLADPPRSMSSPPLFHSNAGVAAAAFLANSDDDLQSTSSDNGSVVAVAAPILSGSQLPPTQPLRGSNSTAAAAALLLQSDDASQSESSVHVSISCQPLSGSTAALAVPALMIDPSPSPSPEPAGPSNAAAAAAALFNTSNDDSQSDSSVDLSIPFQGPSCSTAASAVSALLIDGSQSPLPEPVRRSNAASAAAALLATPNDDSQSDSSVDLSIPFQGPSCSTAASAVSALLIDGSQSQSAPPLFRSSTAAAAAALLFESDDEQTSESSDSASGDPVEPSVPQIPGRFTARDFAHLPLDLLVPAEAESLSDDEVGR